MRKLRIGMVGLGGIAQKAYLPLLSRETGWELAGIYTPDQRKRNRISKEYRLKAFNHLDHLAEECDAAFVHSSTDSHYEVVSALMQKGLDVYVDKPLAATIEQSERLVDECVKSGRKLMVGFNRRFAPLYVQAKAMAGTPAWVRFDKHRMDDIGPAPFEFTMLDDYLHLVDTIRWLNDDGNMIVSGGAMVINESNELVHAKHTFQSSLGMQCSTGMHRRAGTQRETLEIISDGRILTVSDMNVLEVEEGGRRMVTKPSSWDTILKQRGFEDAVMHFIQSVMGDTPPCIGGEQALESHYVLEGLLKDH
ncbi:Gfo/Idh/MocA family protein [Rossellomorea marisflavi]|uniref:Gfo/Idh/MocA family protein n=1 Tax=Rossellomorea marisflavi TaxID=189381 RepID=UPI00351601CC